MTIPVQPREPLAPHAFQEAVVRLERTTDHMLTTMRFMCELLVDIKELQKKQLAVVREDDCDCG